MNSSGVSKCASCIVDDATKKMLEAARIGRQTANGPEAQKKRAVKARANALAQHSWKESDQDLDQSDETFREYERVVDPKYLDEIRAQAKEFSTKRLSRQARLAKDTVRKFKNGKNTSGLVLFES